jgi:hypothetical protein
MELRSQPSRTNLQTSPLHDLEGAKHGIGQWDSSDKYGSPALSEKKDFMQVRDSGGTKEFRARGALLRGPLKGGTRLTLAVTHEADDGIVPKAWLSFHSVSGALITAATELVLPTKDGRFVSKPIIAPRGSVSMRLWLGGRNNRSTAGAARFKDVVLCRTSDGDTSPFSGYSKDGDWAGAVNRSESIHHPPTNITVTSSRVRVEAGRSLAASAYFRGVGGDHKVQVQIRLLDKEGKQVRYEKGDFVTAVTGGAWKRASVVLKDPPATAVTAEMLLHIPDLKRDDKVRVDCCLLESGTTVVGSYFDGSTRSTTTTVNAWGDLKKPHASYSVQTTTAVPAAIPKAETPTTKTLVAAGGATKNSYKMAFFYSFENEVGESAMSKITEIRVSRGQSNWLWETANSEGEPSGTVTSTADLCADQVVATIPRAVYDEAVEEGALRWNLYVLAWSDQDPVPVTGILYATRELYPDPLGLAGSALPYEHGGWLRVTPSRRVGIDDAPLPTQDNRINYSLVPRAKNGLAAGERVVLVGESTRLATIRWSSNRPGQYTNFSASRGGGEKTLSSGNLHIPSSVVLWQNPQSVDTLTILCMGADDDSIAYYMAPAVITAQTGSTSVIGFEQVTGTPGAMSPYATEVLNNALYRPVEKGLLKSSAANYNINHKVMTDTISNVWQSLRTKQWVMSAQLDNRLYYLVNNPNGEPLEEDCKGNEIWVLDITAESLSWSRLLVQGHALRTLTVGTRMYMSVSRPDGLFYLDPEYREDDWVDAKDPKKRVHSRPIPWQFETNTQGANRAHDAWAHLQQAQITLGDFQGTMEYGVRGLDAHGRMVEKVKRFTDDMPPAPDEVRWDIDDVLLIQRDLKEWALFARSVEGESGTGRVERVQYRYTPVSVNIGYELGSIETFEYGRAPDRYSDNGIPLNSIDRSRP